MLDNEYGTAGRQRVCTRPEPLACGFGLARPSERLPVAPVRVHGHEAAVVCRLDASEHARRAPFGARRPVLADWGPLNLLMGLPYEEAVPVASLTARERSMVPRLPDWTHTVHDGHIRRTARPPLMPVLAVIEARSWAMGMTKALVYTEFCAPVVVDGRAARRSVRAAGGRGERRGAGRGGRAFGDAGCQAAQAFRQHVVVGEHAYWKLPR